MKRSLLAATPVALLLLALVWGPAPEAPHPTPAPGGTEIAPQEPLKGPDRERWFFDDWHGPDHGPVLDAQTLDTIWSQIRALPALPARAATDAWELIGPSGMTTDSSSIYSGRILDIHGAYDFSANEVKVWIAAASGGLWRFDDDDGSYTPLTEGLPTQAAGTVSVDPSDVDRIVYGTGEFGIRAGAGIFRSTDGGATWTNPLGNATTGAVHRVRHATSNLVLAVAEKGVFRSTDGGASWVHASGGRHFDLSLDAATSNVAHTIWDDASGTTRSVKTTDGGLSWVASGLTVTGGKRGAIAVAPSNSAVVYAAISRTDNTLEGVYRSTDGGGSWSEVLAGTPANDYMKGQGWYDNVISVDPVDEDIVYVGGVTWKKSTDGGATWQDLGATQADGLHVDFHAMSWFIPPPAARASRFFHRAPTRGGSSPVQFIGHDGGFSFGDGTNFFTSANEFPITQFVHVHAGRWGFQTIGGGSQDNGISITTDGGASWFFRRGGDGSDVCIDPNDETRIWSINGVWSPPAFRRFRSTDQGVTWTQTENGIAITNNWYTDIVNDQVNPVFLYTNAGSLVYRSDDYADTWTSLGTFSKEVRHVSAARWDLFEGPGVYATLQDATAGNRVWMYDDDTWHPRDTGLPTGVQIRAVVPHPQDPTECFALVNGIGTPGQKVYRSTDRGTVWTNITGNLPDVPLGGLVAHPTDSTKVYLGTAMGAYRTTDGGATWEFWNTGMPDAAIISDMTYADERSATGRFYVIAGTYGRSMYRAEVLESAVGVTLADAPAPSLHLAQNAPNPHRGSTRIAFTLPAEAPVNLSVYDVAGRKVTTLVDDVMAGGRHEVPFHSERIAPGAYFYRLETGGRSLSRKMLVVR